MMSDKTFPDGAVFVIHPFPGHFDEYVAVEIGRVCEEDDRFEKAPILYLNEEELAELHTVKPDKDIREFGIGEGPYNEHATASHPRIEGECAATLYAKALGVRDDPKWKEILDYAVVADTAPKELFRDDPSTTHHRWAFFHSILFNTSKHCGISKADVIEAFVSMAIQSASAHFDGLLTGGDMVNEVKLTFQISGGRFGAFKKARIGALASDNTEAINWALKGRGGKFNIAIVQREDGHVQIMGGYNLPADLASAIRIRENEKQGRAQMARWETRVERCASCPEWYFSGQMLFNGSLTDPKNTPPTKLTLEEIFNTVIAVLEKLPEDCSAERCHSADGI
ncbi:MAG: hypothetical protein NTW50_02415 [Candidatus Berkelbacteria bacterium]|nr:hypothetical protein [Candidatus Berkelbacteria bacterium]